TAELAAVTSRAEPYGPILGTPDRSAILCTKPRILVRGAAAQLGDETYDDDGGDGIASPGMTSGVLHAGEGGSATPGTAPVHTPVTDAMLLGAASDGSDWLT